MLQSFTFGFEIEGYFHNNLKTDLPENSFLNGSWHEDGSVHISDIRWRANELLRTRANSLDTTEEELRGRNCSTEYSSPVFEDFETFHQTLQAFKFNENYIANDSCGLHVHVKQKPDALFERSLLTSRHGQKFMYTAALTLAKKMKLQTQIARLTGKAKYCMPYKYEDTRLLNAEWKNHEKYRFVRNHPQGTMEFRFFSPLGKKDEYVHAFFDKLEKFTREVRRTDCNEINLKSSLSLKKIRGPIELKSRIVRVHTSEFREGQPVPVGETIRDGQDLVTFRRWAGGDRMIYGNALQQTVRTLRPSETFFDEAGSISAASMQHLINSATAPTGISQTTSSVVSVTSSGNPVIAARNSEYFNSLNQRERDLTAQERRILTHLQESRERIAERQRSEGIMPTSSTASY